MSNVVLLMSSMSVMVWLSDSGFVEVGNSFVFWLKCSYGLSEEIATYRFITFFAKMASAVLSGFLFSVACPERILCSDREEFCPIKLEVYSHNSIANNSF